MDQKRDLIITTIIITTTIMVLEEVGGEVEVVEGEGEDGVLNTPHTIILEVGEVVEGEEGEEGEEAGNLLLVGEERVKGVVSPAPIMAKNFDFIQTLRTFKGQSSSMKFKRRLSESLLDSAQDSKNSAHGLKIFF